MKLLIRFKTALIAFSLVLVLSGQAQNPPPNAPAPATAAAPANPVPPPTTTTAAPAVAPATGAATNAPAGAGATGAPQSPSLEGDDNQISFQNANIDMVVQWLAKATGKSVVKHPQVQTQLTIVGSKGLKPREAINLIYRALALEGITAIETAKSILIVPEGKEPKTTPEFTEAGDLPEGRQRLVRIFQLQHIAPGEAQQKIRTALSEKATVEVNERGNQLIITDYTDNLRLAGDLIKELDVVSSSDTGVEFFRLKFGEAEEIGNLLGQILNAQVNLAPQSSPPPSSRSSSSSSRMIMPSGMESSPPPSSSSSSSGTSTGSPSAAIKIWPDKSANQLIVVAPKAKMAEIKGLLEILDTEKPQDFTIRIITLRNVSAEDLVREMSPLLQRMIGKSNRDRVEISANNRSNSLIVLSTEENFKALEKWIAALDREDAQEKAIRTFELKNADAEDVAKQLTDLNQDQSSNTRYPYVIFSDFSGRGRDNKKINVVADRRRNTIIVQAPPAAMDDIKKLIETLDAPINDPSLAPKIYKMKFVSAVDIADVLNELFLKKQQSRTYWDPYGFPMADTSDRDARSGNKLFGKVRITAEPYSNSIIITSNSAENLSAIEEVLNQLDAPSQAGETTMRITLNFANATRLASELNVLFARGGSPALRPQPQNPQQPQPQPQQQGTGPSQNTTGLEQEAKEDAYFPWLGGQQENNFSGRPGETGAQRPVSDLIGKVRVVPDRRSNSILLTSNLHFFPQLLKLVSELDAPTPQVLLEARIIEVASDFRDKLGVRWSPDGSTFTGEDLDNSIKIDTATALSKVFMGLPGGSAVAKSGVFAATANVDFLIQFLRKNANAKILAQPQLNIADNELGKLFVGAQVPFLSGSLITDVGGQNNTFQYRDVGIILEVTPRINSSNEVALRIRTESSNIREGEQVLGANILDTRSFRTDLMLRDGETAVLGGIIQSQHLDLSRKTPGLGSIPGLRWAFNKKDKTTREVELIVFLTPRITRTPEEARRLQIDTLNKLPLINAFESEMNPPPKPEPEKKPKS